MKTLQRRQQQVTGGDVPRAQPQLSGSQRLQAAQLLLCRFQQAQRRAGVLVQDAALRGQLHLFGTAHKQLHPQLLLQLTDRLADRRLRQKQLLRCTGKAFVLRHLTIDPIIFQLGEQLHLSLIFYIFILLILIFLL